MASGAISMYGAQLLLGDFFGRAMEWPATLYVALVRQTAPGAFTEGLELDEPDPATGYERLIVENSIDIWARDAETVTNSTDFRFAPCMATWGTIRYWALCNSLTEGQVIAYGDFTESVPTLETDELIIPAGTLSFVMGPIFGSIADGG